MDEREKLALYEQLEPWVLRLARRMSSGPLARWADDIDQEARVALWQAVSLYDPTKHDKPLDFVKWKTIMLLRDTLDKYGRWESREEPSDDLFLT